MHKRTGHLRKEDGEEEDKEDGQSSAREREKVEEANRRPPEIELADAEPILDRLGVDGDVLLAPAPGKGDQDGSNESSVERMSEARQFRLNSSKISLTADGRLRFGGALFTLVVDADLLCN